MNLSAWLWDGITIAVCLAVIVGGRWKRDDEATALTGVASIQFKGMAAVIIVMHHASFIFPTGLLFKRLQTLGFLMTGVFFFLSGYGVQLQYGNGAVSFGAYVKKRMKKVLVPFLIATVVYLVYWLVNEAEDMNYLSAWLHGDLVKYSYYIWDIIFLYFLYGFSYLFLKKNRDVIFAVGIVLLFAFLWVTQRENIYWYSSLLMFPAGMLLVRRRNSFEKLLKRRGTMGLLVFMTLLLFATVLICWNWGHKALGNLGFLAILMNICCGAFCLSIYSISGKVSPDSRVWKWIGKYSYFVYLFHGLFLEMLSRVFPALI